MFINKRHYYEDKLIKSMFLINKNVFYNHFIFLLYYLNEIFSISTKFEPKMYYINLIYIIIKLKLKFKDNNY